MFHTAAMITQRTPSFLTIAPDRLKLDSTFRCVRIHVGASGGKFATWTRLGLFAIDRFDFVTTSSCDRVAKSEKKKKKKKKKKNKVPFTPT